MANSYDSRRDLISYTYKRGQAPGRDTQLVTPDDTNDLPIYGKLRVYNPGTTAGTLRFVPVSAQDDSVHVDVSVPAGITYEQFIARAVRATGTTNTLVIHVIA
jgi:hypothetical protein